MARIDPRDLAGAAADGGTGESEKCPSAGVVVFLQGLNQAPFCSNVVSAVKLENALQKRLRVCGKDRLGFSVVAAFDSQKGVVERSLGRHKGG